MFHTLKQAFLDFIDDDCPTMAAALSYYTVFSLPPLLTIVVTLAGLVFGAEQVTRALREQAGDMIGPSAANQIQTMIQSTSIETEGGWWKVLLGIAALLFGATTAFAQLQTALNRTWEVKPDPDSGGAKQFAGKRILSFGFILVLGFLLLVAMVLSAAIQAMGGVLGSVLGGLSEPVLYLINLGFSLLLFSALFAALFKYLPDALVTWKDVSAGAFLTAIAVLLGKFLLGLYIGATDPTQAYGAAGSVILILLWVYYTSMIVLLGAEFTQVWARVHGRSIEPEAGAVRDSPQPA